MNAQDKVEPIVFNNKGRESEKEIQDVTPDFMTIPGFLGFINKDGKVMSREFLYRTAKQGKIPTYRINKKIFVRLSEVLNALRQNVERANGHG